MVEDVLRGRDTQRRTLAGRSGDTVKRVQAWLTSQPPGHFEFVLLLRWCCVAESGATATASGLVSSRLCLVQASLPSSGCVWKY